MSVAKTGNRRIEIYSLVEMIYQNKLVRVAVCEWPQKDCIYDAEDRAVRPNTKCESNDGSNCKTRSLEESSNTELQILKPDVKAGPKEVVTILKVKNMSYGPIAGLRVDEYWYDAKGGVIAGDSKRMKQLVQSGEVVTFELHTARDPKMQRNTYQFTHANGKVKVDSVKKFN